MHTFLNVCPDFTGEEGETTAVEVGRIKLHYFKKDGAQMNWAERARECTLHLNCSKSEQGQFRARIIIRTKETKIVVFNALLWPSMVAAQVRNSQL